MAVDLAQPWIYDVRQPILGDSFNWAGTEPTAAKTSFVIHATAAKAPNEDAFTIADYHVNTNGWGGIGVHFVCTEDGYPGKPQFGLPAGAHIQYAGDLGTWRAGCANQNPGRVHIEISGLFTSGNGVPSESQLRAVRQLIDFLLAKNNILPSFNYYSQVTYHNAVPEQNTSCPGWDNPQFAEWFKYLQGGPEPSWWAQATPPAPTYPSYTDIPFTTAAGNVMMTTDAGVFVAPDNRSQRNGTYPQGGEVLVAGFVAAGQNVGGVSKWYKDTGNQYFIASAATPVTAAQLASPNQPDTAISSITIPSNIPTPEWVSTYYDKPENRETLIICDAIDVTTNAIAQKDIPKGTLINVAGYFQYQSKTWARTVWAKQNGKWNGIDTHNLDSPITQVPVTVLGSGIAKDVATAVKAAVTGKPSATASTTLDPHEDFFGPLDGLEKAPLSAWDHLKEFIAIVFSPLLKLLGKGAK